MGGELAASSFKLCQQRLLFGHFSREKWKAKLKKRDWKCHAGLESKAKQELLANNQMATKPDTYSSRISTDIPLYESPGASFDRYLEDKPRVFEAIFPDKMRGQQLNEEDWRVQMLPITFLFITVWPVVDMRLRCKSGGRDYPLDVPEAITKVLELEIIRWELQGLDDVVKPSHFSLGVKGALYPDRQAQQTRLKGQLEMSMSAVLPPALALIPENIRRNVAELVLTRLVDNMKHKVNGSLLADYSKFQSETTNNVV